MLADFAGGTAVIRWIQVCLLVGALRTLLALPHGAHEQIRFCAMTERDELDETVSVRFPAKVRARLEQLADADDRRVSQVVRRIVVRALERQDDGVAA